MRIVLSARRCVKGLTTFPRMLTPVAGFRRLLEPLPQSVPTSDVLQVALGHRRVRSSGPISASDRTLRCERRIHPRV